jgi:hypothetical protein
MATFTVLTEQGATVVDGDLAADEALVAPAVVESTLGWTVKPEGLCRAEVCVPWGANGAPAAGAAIDLVATASRLGHATLVDAEAAVVVVGVSAERRRGAVDALELPEFTLPDLDGTAHSSHEWSRRKRLLVAFSSW